MATSTAAARRICSGLVDMVADKAKSFDGKWKLRIFSPYSGDHPTTVCTLL
jgi:hypothetical protein